jgi:hypothetical protein
MVNYDSSAILVPPAVLPSKLQFWLLWPSILVVLSSQFRHYSAHAVDVSFQDDSSSIPCCRNSSIYTYFEYIPAGVRTTGMSDEDDKQLLEFWKESWSSNGWKPIILRIEDVKKLDGYSSLESELENELRPDPWSHALFHRWMAMAAIGGGWYVDYDVFPLPEFIPPVDLPHNERMTVHDIHSPTLASGSGEQWLLTIQALLSDAKQNASPVAERATFWTDSLGINNLVKNHGKQEPAPLIEKRVILPHNHNDPVWSRNIADCVARSVRNRWVVHMGPRVFQTAKHLAPAERHPRNRRKEAQKWLQQWGELCYPPTGPNNTTIA